MERIVASRVRRRKILALHWSGKSYKELGEQFGICSSRAHQLANREERELISNIMYHQFLWLQEKEDNN